MFEHSLMYFSIIEHILLNYIIILTLFEKKNVFKSLIILSTFLNKNISKYILFLTCTYGLTSEKKTLLSSSFLQV